MSLSFKQRDVTKSRNCEKSAQIAWGGGVLLVLNICLRSFPIKYGFVNSVKNCLSNILIVFKPNSPVWGKKGNKAKGEGGAGWMKMVATEQHIIKINGKSEQNQWKPKPIKKGGNFGDRTTCHKNQHLLVVRGQSPSSFCFSNVTCQHENWRRKNKQSEGQKTHLTTIYNF